MRTSVGEEVKELVVVRRVGSEVYSHRTEAVPGVNHFLESSWEWEAGSEESLEVRASRNCETW